MSFTRTSVSELDYTQAWVDLFDAQQQLVQAKAGLRALHIARLNQVTSEYSIAVQLAVEAAKKNAVLAAVAAMRQKAGLTEERARAIFRMQGVDPATCEKIASDAYDVVEGVSQKPDVQSALKAEVQRDGSIAELDRRVLQLQGKVDAAIKAYYLAEIRTAPAMQHFGVAYDGGRLGGLQKPGDFELWKRKNGRLAALMDARRAVSARAGAIPNGM